MSVFQNRPWETNIHLSLTGTPVTGVLFSQIVVKLRKFGQTALTTKTISSGDWSEVGNGFYILRWLGSDLDTLGKFTYTVTGSLFDRPFLYDEFDVDPVPLPLTVPLANCILTGNVSDIGGNPGFNHTISIRPATFPLQVSNSIITGDSVRTVPDSLGNFSIVLLRGQLVIIEIDRTGLKVQVTIPNAPTAALTSLLPAPPPPL